MSHESEAYDGFGLPMLGWFMLVAVLLVPVFWPL
jgi:hypothetical protein